MSLSWLSELIPDSVWDRAARWALPDGWARGLCQVRPWWFHSTRNPGNRGHW